MVTPPCEINKTSLVYFKKNNSTCIFQDFERTSPLQIDFLACGLIKVVEIHVEELLVEIINRYLRRPERLFGDD